VNPMLPEDEVGTLRAITLVRHPETPCPAVQSIQAQASLLDARSLALTFVLEGELKQIHLPASQEPERMDRLWEHTCFEAFIAGPGEEGYREFNFAPSRAWAAYAFHHYREGGTPIAGTDPQINLRRRAGRLELEILLHLDPVQAGSRLHLGLSAVIELEDGSRSYWAIHHPPGHPDFHHRSSFALEIGFDD